MWFRLSLYTGPMIFSQEQSRMTSYLCIVWLEKQDPGIVVRDYVTVQRSVVSLKLTTTLLVAMLPILTKLFPGHGCEVDGDHVLQVLVVH